MAHADLLSNYIERRKTLRGIKIFLLLLGNLISP
jgi:hypothetical protein